MRVVRDIFQQLIGVLRWETEIGRLHMLLFEVLLLSQYWANPRKGHTKQLLHIMIFLKKHPILTLNTSPSHETSTDGSFQIILYEEIFLRCRARCR